MPAPSSGPSSGLQASLLTASPFYSPMYTAYQHDEKESAELTDSRKQQLAEQSQQQWRPHPSPLLLATSPATGAVPTADEVGAGEWTLSPIVSHQAAQPSSHRAAPMSPLVLPLSTAPLPPRSQSVPPSSSYPSCASSSSRPGSAASAAAPSLSSPFASLQPSPSLHPFPYQSSPLQRAQRPGPSHSHARQLDTPPSRPSASPRLSAMHHSAFSPLTHSMSGHGRGPLSDVCPSPLLSPSLSPPLSSQLDSSMPQLSLDQHRMDGRHRQRQQTKAADRETATVEQQQLSHRRRAAAAVGSLVGSGLLSSSSSWRLACSSWLRSSRLLLFAAVVTGVILFQLLCAVWLLPSSPSSTDGWSSLQRSASLAQLERSRQSAHSFQQSHAAHSHAQHRDDEALRQAVADLQEHVRAHSNNNNDQHGEQRAPHTFEEVELDGALRGSEVKHDKSPQLTDTQQAAIEPIDAENSWK